MCLSTIFQYKCILMNHNLSLLYINVPAGQWLIRTGIFQCYVIKRTKMYQLGKPKVQNWIPETLFEKKDVLSTHKKTKEHN